MTQGLFTAVSGIRANQASLDVISNNIANVNTTAFKSSQANFATVFANTVSGGSAPQGQIGGTNPLQVGNGVYLSQVSQDFSQGGTQFTGRSTDLLIQGEGFFVSIPSPGTGDTTGFKLTRSGNFSLDATGNLVTASGGRLQGTSFVDGPQPADAIGLVNMPLRFQIAKFLDVNGNVLGTSFGSEAATGANFAADAAARSIVPTTTDVETVSLVNFTIGNSGALSGTYSNGDRISVRVNPDGSGRTEIVHFPAQGGVYPAINFAGDDGSSGQLAGALAVFTNTNATANPMEGMQLQLQTATVTNPKGLISQGNNEYIIGSNSGTTFFGIPGAGNRGVVQSGALESSNVDLAGEFSNLVIAQRGLEASSRIIRSQSEVLQTIINVV